MRARQDLPRTSRFPLQRRQRRPQRRLEKRLLPRTMCCMRLRQSHPPAGPWPLPAPPAPSPATAQDRAQQRWEVLSKINSLVAEADRIAKRRLGKTDLTDAERIPRSTISGPGAGYVPARVRSWCRSAAEPAAGGVHSPAGGQLRVGHE